MRKVSSLMRRLAVEVKAAIPQPSHHEGFPAGEIELTPEDWFINRAVARRLGIPNGSPVSARMFQKRRIDLWRSGRGWRAKWPIGCARGYVKCRLLNLIDGEKNG